MTDLNPRYCDASMSFSECELAILRHAVDENQLLSKRQMATSPDINKMVKIVEKFMRDKKLICYGGTAINNLLPKPVQFYNEDDVPDYDFFSRDPLNDAIELADIFFEHKFDYIEAKSGVHAGTFKVYVNFVAIADITYLHPVVYRSLQEEAIAIEDILYAPVNFLRMDMYKELSRPQGNVARWEKVSKRLSLLNEHFPLLYKPCGSAFHAEIGKNGRKVHTAIRDIFIHAGAVFFGGYAASMYREFASAEPVSPEITEFSVLYVDIEQISLLIETTLNKMNIRDIVIVRHERMGELLPAYNEVRIRDHVVAYIYVPIACHSYNVLQSPTSDKVIKIATIDTMLTFFLAFLYANIDSGRRDRLMCMTQFVFEIQEKNKLSQTGLLKRFTMSCYGKQESMNDMRVEKQAKFKELKHDRSSVEYNMRFLNYKPTGKKNKKRFRKKSVEFNDVIQDPDGFVAVPLPSAKVDEAQDEAPNEQRKTRKLHRRKLRLIKKSMRINKKLEKLMKESLEHPTSTPTPTSTSTPPKHNRKTSRIVSMIRNIIG
jgi:Poly(A) polymerase catalytic subunit